MSSPRRLRLATYNIAKGVRGLGPARRLEIHTLRHGVRELDADLVCLQEVRAFHERDARRFARHGWPEQPQAHYLAPEGFEVAYRSNAFTDGGEHGNALLSRWPIEHVGHHDVSDHRLEQRGLLHVRVDWQGSPLHVVVMHLGLFAGSRLRQVHRLGDYLSREVPADAPLLVAGDFNDWNEKLDPALDRIGLSRAAAEQRPRTFPARAPLFALDRVYLRGLRCSALQVPVGLPWVRMSDHLPLVAELEADTHPLDPHA
ncbi:endonuclease/exonuclease/phosphatase family metal-dependent hydrolase [Inhella inkyongensis]|uniref:Endonuclease/exonuclease/phosphatase family metal-dependent hydrolase n=1 Tax=Inhella inkyongensis TaxID=392593 RepID=A0A840S6A7_9BURK|nr:endonuclease/exonuclease/phosphatase family protein [Inhella inkyongensis]MBB5204324.1 endonuclease/exonuclease/phosphatase family metal-dependent hydrolase [Inhella inkyongensis]